MRTIRIEHVSKAYNGDQILDDLNLTIPSGQFFALLGPSGSGKTTLLRLIAGFETPDSGRIFIGDKDITQVPINERKVNTVFQQYALFPHLNVFDNVAYGLRVKGLPEKEIEQRVRKILTVVHLEKQMYKAIDQLSGGQKQRVALARAVVNEPDVLLLDEPLAALDLKLRERMLVELVALQDQLKTTFVYVTHDQTEALTVADTMAIMNSDGEIEQVGTPKEIYEFPRSTFVAHFVGTTNTFEGTLHMQDEHAMIDVPHLGRFAVPFPTAQPWACNGCKVVLSVRPEKIRISKVPLEGFSNVLQGVVESIIYYGRSTQYNVRMANDAIVQVFEQNIEHVRTQVIDYEDSVYLYWHTASGVVLNK